MLIAAVSAGAVVVAREVDTAQRTNHLGVFVVGQRVRKRGDEDARRERSVARAIAVFDVVIAIVRWRPAVEAAREDDDVGRPVTCLASLTAASVASAPELAKKNVSMAPG